MAWYWYVIGYVAFVALLVAAWSRFMGGLKAQDRVLWGDDETDGPEEK